MLHESASRIPALLPGVDVLRRVRFPSDHGLATEGVAESIIGTMILRGARRLTGIHARWVGCGPSDTQRIYFANHSSHLDAVLLWAALPEWLRRKTRPVAAADYWKPMPWRRYLAERVFHSVFVERDGADHSLNRIAPMLEALDDGDSLILFPEGTRGSGVDLQPFRSGIFHLACERPAIELVPVWLDNCYQVLPKGAVVPLPLICTATFGRPPHIGANEEKPAFLQRLRQSLLDLRKTRPTRGAVARKEH